jgi:multisubunit Na+/H+ antiporter MnhB subunit
MDTWFVISGVVLAVGLGLVILVTVMLWQKNKEGKPKQPDYRVFFIMGAVMVPLGIAEMLLFLQQDRPLAISLPLVVIGLVFLAIGLANRGKWQKVSDKPPPTRWDRHLVEWVFLITLVLGGSLFMVLTVVCSDISGSPTYQADGACDRCGASASYIVTKQDSTTGQTETVHEFCFLHAVTKAVSMDDPSMNHLGGFGSGTVEVRAATYVLWASPWTIAFVIAYKVVRRYGSRLHF